MLNRAREGFSSLAVDPAFQASALKNLAFWWETPALAAYRPQIEALVEKENWDHLLDAFYQVIPFGTGGRRGAVGIGPNRINAYTLGTSIQGHAQYLQKSRGTGPLSVVVAYDVRRYLDSRGVYRRDLVNPVLGLSSRDFAELAAGVYAANGIRVHMLGEANAYLSTPELSFAIRYYGADGGLNVSASHNPPDDNGAKIYDQHGGQAIPPHDEALVREVEGVLEPRQIGYEEALERGLIQLIGPDLHEAYLETNLRLSSDPTARSAHVVFTPLHGTGGNTVAALLAEAGFQVEMEAEQATPDGAFPTVPFAAPNPEVPEAMDRAVAWAEERGADVVMSCDPDADRLGMVVRTEEGWRHLTGNELGVLLVEQVLRMPPVGSQPRIVIKTEVTTTLVTRVARSCGAQVVDDLLVGFKYIGEGLRQLEASGSFRGARGGVEDFAVGVEESHGLLVTPEIRDKDAAGAALLLAEAASQEKDRGRTLVSRLEHCWQELGYVSNLLISTVMRGATGRTRIEAIQRSLREDPPSEIGGRRVLEFQDRQDIEGPFGAILSGTDFASRDVLVFALEGAARLVLRPSGTEPKTKVYAEIQGEPGGDLSQVIPAMDADCLALAQDFVALMLKRVDLVLPMWALRISNLVPIEQKQHFADTVMPELLLRLQAQDPVEDWLDSALSDFGRDARVLVRPGVEAWLADHEVAGEIAQRLETLFQGFVE